MRSAADTLLVALLACSAASGADKLSPEAAPEIPTCEAYLTAADVIKRPGPVMAEIQPLRDRYNKLDVGIAWGKESYLLPINMGANTYQINRDILPTVPRPDEVPQMSFVIGMRGQLKDPANELIWANSVFSVNARPGNIYELSGWVDKDSADGDLFMYLTALNAVPYADRLELSYVVTSSEPYTEVFKRIKALLMNKHSDEDIGNRMAPPAIKGLHRSSLFIATVSDVVQFQSGQPTNDPMRADSFMITYRFALKSRPAFH